MLGRDPVAAGPEVGFVLMRIYYGGWNAAKQLRA